MAMQVTITEVVTTAGENPRKLAISLPDNNKNCLVSLQISSYYKHEIWVKATDLAAAFKMLSK